MWSREKVSAKIDHTILKPRATDDDVREACSLAMEFKTASVCVRPTDLPLAVGEMTGSNIPVCTVVGFPFGYNLTEAKVTETGKVLEQGAGEVDMVMNVGRFLSGDRSFVEDDIRSVVDVAHKHDALVKVILEVCLLTWEQIADACRIVETAGADFVKTSTGFAGEGATPEAVDIMINTVGGRLGVKAAGGIKTFGQAVAYLEKGCTRLGVSGTKNLLQSD